MNEFGISWPVFVEDRVTVSCLNDGRVALSTYQKGNGAVFCLTKEQARHLANRLLEAASTENQPPKAA